MAFDAERYKTMTTGDAMETRRQPVPSGEYRAMIEKVEPQATKKDPNAEKGFILWITYHIMDEDLAKQLEREKVTLRQVYYIELDENGGFAMGPDKNTQLGALREACGQNEPGQPWAPSNLEGQGPLLIQVSQRPDENDESVMYNDVKRVVAA